MCGLPEVTEALRRGERSRKYFLRVNSGRNFR